MADFIHAREWLNAGDVVEVVCDHQCNVRLTDDLNFQNYRRGGQHRAWGGFYRAFPARIAAPRSGYWNVTIDLGGGRANIRHSIRYLKRETV